MVGSLLEFSSTAANLDILTAGGRVGSSSESESESGVGAARRGGGGGGGGGDGVEDGGGGGGGDGGVGVNGDNGDNVITECPFPRLALRYAFWLAQPQARYGQSEDGESFGRGSRYPGGDNGGNSRRGSLDPRRSRRRQLYAISRENLDSCRTMNTGPIDLGHIPAEHGLVPILAGVIFMPPDK
ncbi:hypothetical protein B0H12DRAFT_1076401 [Mycena haematopus]|nr:hypothetical protein B0H12DRAFT_1076401 [Mycena haematopus]